jgi:hypothetical protein
MRADLAVAGTNTTTVPWWGVPVIAGAFAIGGALVTVMFNYIREKREQDRRWEKDLRQACASFAASLEQLAYQTDMNEAWAAYNDAKGAAYRYASEVELLAPKALIPLATDATFRAIDVAKIRATDAEELDVAVAIARYLKARVYFINEARRALGIEPLPDPEGE